MQSRVCSFIVVAIALLANACSSGPSQQQTAAAVASLTVANETLVTEANEQHTSRVLRIVDANTTISCQNAGTATISTVDANVYAITYANCEEDGVTLNSPSPVTPVDFSVTTSGDTVTASFSGGPVSVTSSSGTDSLAFTTTSTPDTVTITTSASGGVTVTATGSITDNGNSVTLSGVLAATAGSSGATGPSNTVAVDCGTTSFVLANPAVSTTDGAPYGPSFSFSACGSVATDSLSKNLADSNQYAYLDATFSLPAGTGPSNTSIFDTVTAPTLDVWFNISDSNCVFADGAAFNLKDGTSTAGGKDDCVDIGLTSSFLDLGSAIDANCSGPTLIAPFLNKSSENCENNSTSGVVTIKTWSRTPQTVLTLEFGATAGSTTGASLSMTNINKTNSELSTVPASLSGSASAIVGGSR